MNKLHHSDNDWDLTMPVDTKHSPTMMVAAVSTEIQYTYSDIMMHKFGQFFLESIIVFKHLPVNIAWEHFPIHSRALSCSCLHLHSYLDRLAVRTHADVDYCTDYHNSLENYNYLIASAIVPAIPIFADAPYKRVKLASDDCNFGVDFAFVVDPDWILAQHV